MATVVAIQGQTVAPTTPTTNQILTYSGGSWGPAAPAAALNLNLSSQAQGTLCYYSGSAWVTLAVGTAGQLLQTGGAAANPSWVNVPAATNLNLTSQAQGTICYYNGTAWVVLPVGTAGQVLQSGGASANVSWTAAGGSVTWANDLSGSSSTHQYVVGISGGSSPSTVSVTATALQFAAATTTPTIQQLQAASGSGQDFYWRSSSSQTSGTAGSLRAIIGKSNTSHGAFVIAEETIAGGAFTNMLTFTPNAGSNNIIIAGGQASQNIYIESHNGNQFLQLNDTNTIIGGTQLWQNGSGSTYATFTPAAATTLAFASTLTSAVFSINTVASGTTAANFTIAAQSNSNGGSTGGNVELKMGTGTTANGQLMITNAGTLATTASAVAGGFAVPSTLKGLPVTIDGTSYKILLASP